MPSYSEIIYNLSGNPNYLLKQPMFAGDNLGRDVSSLTNISPVPASNIEKTMFWLDRIAEQHDWVNRYSSDPLITTNGFVWKRHNGLELETFVPKSSQPYELTGYPTSRGNFWDHFRDIIKFVGEKTLRHYDSYGGFVSGIRDNGNISGFKWGNDNRWIPYGKFSETNDTSELITSGIVDLYEASHTKYMGLGGKISVGDYTQYTPRTNASAGLDSISLNATKSFYRSNGEFGFIYILYETLPTDYAYGSPLGTFIGHYISGVLDRTPTATSITCKVSGTSSHNIGTATWNREQLPGGSTFPYFSGYALYDITLDTNYQKYFQSDFSDICQDMIETGVNDKVGWGFSYELPPECNWSFKKENRYAISKKTAIQSFPAYNEQFQISAKLDVSIPITLVYMSRNTKYPYSGDIRFDDYNHYLRSFTGFVPDDSLDITTTTYEYSSNFTGNSGVYSSGVTGPYGYPPPTSTYGNFLNNYLWYFYNSGNYDLSITNNGPIDIIYGYVHYDPFEVSGYNTPIPFIGDSNTGGLDGFTGLLLEDGTLGQKVINEIYDGNYTILGTLTPSFGDIATELAFATPPGIVPGNPFGGGYVFIDNPSENYYYSGIGSINSIVDLDPTDNVMFFAALPGSITVSSFIQSNNAIPAIVTPPWNNQPPMVHDDENGRFLTNTEIIRTRARMSSAMAGFGTRPNNSQPSSFFALPSGSKKYNSHIGAFIGVASDSPLRDSDNYY